MRVIIYVEGISDKLAMQALLRGLMESKMQQGILIDFYETPDGDRKSSVLQKSPVKALNVFLNDPDAIVIAMPDLYPLNRAFPHRTFEEMQAGIMQNFMTALKQKGLTEDQRLMNRFKVFCFKHDLEALILAAEESLLSYLEITKFPITWKKPVEDQNNDMPPKFIVEQLFNKCNKTYQGTVDAPAILGATDYIKIAQKCPQCFKPFADFLESL